MRNLERYQHYKERNPPWVKLHQELLENYDFASLPDASKAHAMSLLVLASRVENRLPDDPGWIGRRINATTKVDLDLLLRIRFLESYQDASDQLAERKQDALPETEAETETEREQRRLCAEPAILTFPTRGKVKTWALTQRHIDEWTELFPDLPVLAEARRALAWVKAKPTRQKTEGGMEAFFVHWLSNATNSQRDHSTSHRGRPGKMLPTPGKYPKLEPVDEKDWV